MNVFDHLEEDLIYLYNRYGESAFLIVGDFNARTGLLQDYVDEISFIPSSQELSELEGNDLADMKIVSLRIKNITLM